MRFSERCRCTRGLPMILEEKPKKSWTLPAKSFERAPSRTSSASGRSSKWREWKCVDNSFDTEKERSIPRRRPPNRRSGREMYGMGSRTLTKSPPPAHSSSTTGCRLGMRATDGPTDIHSTTREEFGHDADAGGTTAPADAAFFVPFFFPLPLPLGFD